MSRLGVFINNGIIIRIKWPQEVFNFKLDIHVSVYITSVLEHIATDILKVGGSCGAVGGCGGGYGENGVVDDG